MRTIAFLQTSGFWDKNVFSNLLKLYSAMALRARSHQSGKLWYIGIYFRTFLPFRIEPENKLNSNVCVEHTSKRLIC